VQTRLVTILGTIIARLNALMAAMVFGFMAQGLIPWDGLPGVIRYDWTGFATFVSSVCAVLTLVFLIPDLAN
jgi:hypothetical protein